MYTLYGKKGSGSASIEAALTMAGAPYRMVETASWETNDAFRELLKINPIGQIPTLALPDGSALSESAAILIHLDVAHPAAGLLPRDEAARAQAIRGLVFIAANCYSAITVLDFPERFCKDMDDSARDRIRAGTRARLHRHWEIFADMFPARPFLGRQRHRRAGSLRGRRDQVVGRARASGRASRRRFTRRCSRSKRIRRWRPCSRATGRRNSASASNAAARSRRGDREYARPAASAARRFRAAFAYNGRSVPAHIDRARIRQPTRCASCSATTTATSRPASRASPQTLAPLAEITVVAPERDRSGASNSLTLDRPLTVRRAPNGFLFVNGTPTDCVHLAVTGLLDELPDMVVSGINLGANMGDDTIYSGTVAAATEGYLLGIPSIAVSLASKAGRHFETAAAGRRRAGRALSRARRSARRCCSTSTCPTCRCDELDGHAR